jgi:hypothetical protein
MNKKAQSGNIIAYVPVILIVFIIMVVFVFIAGMTALLKDTATIDESSSSFNPKAFLETQSLTIETGKRSLTAIDILEQYTKKLISIEQAESLFSEFLKQKGEDKYCFIALPGTDIFYFYYLKGDPEEENSGRVFVARELDLRPLSEVYKKQDKLTIITLRDHTGKQRDCEVYFGPCLSNP